MSQRATRRLGADILFIVLAFSPTLLWQASQLIKSDEGYTFNAAWQLWNGLRMYDDFRLFVAPGSAYAVWGIWAIVGSPSYLAARVLSLALALSSTAAVYLCLRRLGVRGANLAVTVAAWVLAASQYPLINHNAFSSFAATWWLLAILRVAAPSDNDASPPDGRRLLRDQALVGALAGIVCLFLQTKGLSVAAASGVLALALAPAGRKFRAALVVTASYCAVVAPVVIAWGPRTLFEQWFVIPATGDYLGHTGASRIVAVVAVAVVAAMALLSWHRRDPRLRALAVAQAALLASSLHNPELNHLAINCFPLLIFVSLLVATRRSAEQRAGAATPSPVVVMAGIVALIVGATVATPNGRRLAKMSVLVTDLIRRPPRAFMDGPRLAAAHAIYAGPFLPGVYYQLGKNNPFFVSETVVCDDACQQRLIGQLAEVKPEIALLHYDMIRHLDYDQNNPVDVYLRDRYVQCPGPYFGDIIVRARDLTWCP